MAFDPDAFLAGPAKAPAAPAPGFDPDAFLTAGAPAPTAEEEKPEPSLLEAGLRGVKQGLTFGFGDEITGALESAFTSKRYAQARDEARAADKAAKEAHPVGYGLAEILGGVATTAIPGVGEAAGLAKLGTGFAANAARGALAGGLTSAGESEADLTKEGGVKQLVQETAKGGLAGGTLGGILGAATEKYVKGASARADQKLLSEIGDRATPTVRKKIAGASDLVTEVAEQHGLADVAKDPAALLEKAKDAKDAVGKKLGAAYETIDSTSLGASAREALRAVNGVRRELAKSPSDKPLLDEATRYAKTLKETWGSGARDRIPLAQLNAEVGKLERTGFASPSLTPKGGAQLKRDLAGALEDVLQSRFEEIRQSGTNIAKTALAERPAFSGSVDAAAAVEAIPALNKQYRALKLIHQAAGEREPLTKFSPTGLRQIAGEGLHGAGILASLASGSPLPALATHVGIPAAKALDRGATRALAQLSAAARAGQVGPALIQQALAAGVPRGTVEATVSAFGPREPAEATAP